MADDGGAIPLEEARRRRRRANGSGTDEGASWRQNLITSENGAARACLANALTAFRLAPEWKGRIRFNEFRHQIVLHGRAPWQDFFTPDEAEEDWSDTHDTRAAEWLNLQRLFIQPSVVAHAVAAVAREHAYHPVRDYLERQQWDGKPRLDTWARDCLGTADDEYTGAVARRFLIAAVARIFDPGCQVKTCLILEGRQDIRKSSALRTLAVRDEWFTDDLADLGSKDAAQQLPGAWIIELAELDHLVSARAEISRTKAFLSRQIDRYRPSYGRHVVTFRRQCVFAGTVNEYEYLRDETGGVRFWPVRCGVIDDARLRGERDQLWAEAVVRYRAREKWWIETEGLRSLAEQEQLDRFHPDPWLAPIAEYIRRPSTIPDNSVTTSGILADVIGRKLADQQRADTMRVGRCLQLLGCTRFRNWNGGKLEWRYRLPTSGGKDHGGGKENDE